MLGRGRYLAIRYIAWCGYLVVVPALRQDAELVRLEHINAGLSASSLGVQPHGAAKHSQTTPSAPDMQQTLPPQTAPMFFEQGGGDLLVKEASGVNGSWLEGTCKVGCGFVDGRPCSCMDVCVMQHSCCQDYGQFCARKPKIASQVGVDDVVLLGKFWLAAVGIYAALLLLLAVFECMCKVKTSSRTVQEKCDADEHMSGHTFMAAPVSDYTLYLNWFSIRFKHPFAEKQWKTSSDSAKIATACKAMGGMTLVLLLFRVYHEYVWFHTPCLGEFSWSLSCCHIIVLLVAIAMSVVCFRQPGMYLYRMLLAFCFFYVPATGLPPLAWSCRTLKEDCDKETAGLVMQAYQHVDCSMQGHTATQLMLTWVLLQPWIMLRFDHMYAIWAWIIVVYLGWTFLYRHLLKESVFDNEDIVCRTLLLSASWCMALSKKYKLEKSYRLKFLQDLQHKVSSQKIFRVLEFMVPTHVIPRMIADETIAEQVNRVSILFVLIDDFEHFTKSKTPAELLRFLNDQFTSMDNICEHNQVTKIETVMEEYVACVGVLPNDVEENTLKGHGHLLQRLFKASAAILALQHEPIGKDEEGSPAVKFKMGIHTGSIVAGVIGTKLPRYRLFGDTINSAARMMQKGQPGQLQFGEATYEDTKDFPDELKSQIRHRGKVAMKGKGEIEAWTFSPNKEDVARSHWKNVRMITGTSSNSGSARPTVRSKTKILKAGVDPKNLLTTLARMKMSASVKDRYSPDLAHDEDFNRRFEMALQKMSVQSKASSRWVLPAKEGFDAEMEMEWQEMYHEQQFAAKAGCRIGMTVVILMGFSAIEFWFIFSHKVWRYPHAVYPLAIQTRPLLYFYTRGAVIFALVVWWLSVDALPWIPKVKVDEEQVRAARRAFVERGVVYTIMISIIVVFISYEAIVYSDTEAYRHHVNAYENFRAPDDQTPILDFVLIMMTLMGTLPFKFYSSLLFLISCIVCISIHPLYGLLFPGTRWENIFSDQGEFLFFVLTAMVIITCHEDENNSRARYTAQRAVAKTQIRTEYILKTLMPRLDVQELQPSCGLSVISHQYRHATVAQSDLCGFTQLSSNKMPQEVVKYMSDLFGAFDRLTDKHEVYKVETIGDAYIAGMAESPLTEKNLPCNVVLFALDMVRAVDEWARNLGVKVACRAGVHYGECVGGIVGSKMQRYHLFGDLLSVMDTLEATSMEGRVHISQACKKEVERQLRDNPAASYENLEFQERVDIDVLRTSKGEEHSFDSVGGRTFLVGSNRPLRHTCLE